jgi:hypothetical protein
MNIYIENDFFFKESVLYFKTNILHSNIRNDNETNYIYH